MRIVFVTQWFPPEPGILVPRDIAEGLADLGHEVHVLTGVPNYPNGRINPGYRLRAYQREQHAEGITVHRAPLYPSHDQSAVRRMANYVSFAAAASVLALTKVPRGDVTLVYSSPATAALPAIVNRARGVPFALLIQDLWPDSVLDASFLPPRAASLAGSVLSLFCTWSYRLAGAVAVISPGMVDLLVSRGVPQDKVCFTPNWLSDAHLHPDRVASPGARAELGLPAGRTFIYAGNFGDLQNLGPVVEAFRRVPDANLVLVGDGVQRAALAHQISSSGATNVLMADSKPMAEIGRYLAACDVQIVSLRDTPLMRVTMPSKVQTALASGRPVMVCAAGDPERLVEQSGAGYGARQGDVDNLVDTIRRFMDRDEQELRVMGRQARRSYEEQFSSRVGPRRLAAVLETVAKSSRPPRLWQRIFKKGTARDG